MVTHLSNKNKFNRFDSCPRLLKINYMRSKVFQRVLDNMKKDPWYIKLHRWVVVELYDIKCMGIVKYIKHKK